MKSCIKGVGLTLAFVAFLFHLIPFYGMMIGIPVYLINLIFIGFTYEQYDQTDKKLIIWLPLMPIALWLLLILSGILN